MRHRFLLGCLILSGFAGLAYELLWVRLLALSFGSTAASFSTVLAVFFGGLALGSLIGGRIAKRVRRPVRAYALVELGTGVAALVLYPLLLGLESTFGYIDPGPGTAGTVVRFIAATLILIMPTVLMGATLPFVTRAMVRRDEDIGRATAYIYAFNTFGACLGAYVTTFWSLPYLGVFWSTLATVAINVSVFALASRLGSNEVPLATTDDDRAASKRSTVDEPESKLKVVGTVLAAFLGFAAVALQVVWVRIFAAAMQGTVYGTGSVLIAVLVGIGLGSLGLAPFLKRSRHAGAAFVALQIAGGLLVLLQFALLPWISYELGSLQVQRLGTFGLHLQMLIAILAVLGPSVCSGASLPLIIGIVETRAAHSARAVGNVYAANTLGAILGSLLTGFVVLPSAGSEAAVLVAVTALGASISLGALFLLDGPRPFRLALVAVGVVVVGLYDGYDVQALAAGPSPGSFADWVKRAEGQKKVTLMFSEAETSNVRVTENSGARALTLNALGQGGRTAEPPHHNRESLMVAAVPLSHAAQKRKALLVGLGAGVTVDVLLKMGVEHVRVVELEPKVVDAVKIIFYGASPVESDRVDMVINDARHYLNVERSRGGGQYDIIASMPAHPWIASPIFTREFFEIAKANLIDTGIFCSWFGLGKMDRTATDSLLRAFTSVFDHYVIYYVRAHGAYFLVGSPSPVAVDPDRYRAVFEHPVIRAHPELESPLYLPRRIFATSRGANGPTVKPGPMNTDDLPLVEMLSPTTTPTTGVASKDLFSVRGLDPEMVPSERRVAFVEDLLEALLGTPGGKLPTKFQPVDRDAARTLLGRARSSLSPQAVAYFERRLAIIERPTDPAHGPAIEALASEDLRLRARRGWAWAMPPDTPKRAAALAALPPETGVLLLHMRESGRRVLSRVPNRAPDVDADPLGWWLWRLAHAPQLDPPAVARLATKVGPHIQGSQNEVLLVETASVARAANEPTLALAAEQWLGQARRARLQYHRRRGLNAGRQRRFGDAADHLWNAFTAGPQEVSLRMPLAQALVEINDGERLQRFAQALLFQGLNQAQVQFLFAEARRRSAAGKTLEAGGGEPATERPPQPPSPTEARLPN